jgi:APA family basic amino acid/polyamine antiporter
LKILAIAALVICGFVFVGDSHARWTPLLDRQPSLGLLARVGAAMTPVMFAYGGWQTASFVAGEMREPRRDLARGIIFGVIGVMLLYMAVNFVYLHALGANGLAQTTTPATSR